MTTDNFKDLFKKEESTVYKVRRDNKALCKAVITELYVFVESVDNALLDRRTFEKIRNKVTKSFKGEPPRNIELIEAYRNMIDNLEIEPNESVLSVIIKRKVRTLSGIANITVLMKEFGCPGKCIFCPSQPGMPKSYFSTQPAMMRAVRNNFNAYKQVKARLNGLHSQGHDVTKIDVRTAGGTWSSYLHEYQEEFVKGIYFALNEGVGEMMNDAELEKKISETTLEELIKQNENTTSRCVGLWVETRPDWITEEELVRLRRFGVTGIELGIQTTNDKVNLFNKRGHGLAESIKATQMCRDIGLKICHHVMPNLPTATVESDLQTITDLFEKDILNPDYIKIYPCMVLPYTELEKMYKNDSSIYKPYSDEELIDVLMQMKAKVPEYCRIIRLLRDFPSELVLGGTKTLNIRQIMNDQGVECRCVRCREIKNNAFEIDKIELVERKYKANDGNEIFISFEDKDQDKLLGLLRLRLPNIKGDGYKIAIRNFPELKDAALVRELHVYGQQKTLDSKSSLDSKTQHIGFGRKLMARVEELVYANGLKKIAVISAIGTREYYAKLGYYLDGTYMVKDL